MRVVIADSIRKKEFKHGQILPMDLTTILEGYAEGIWVEIKGDSLPKGSRLVKLYVTTVQGARRIVFMIDVATSTGFFLFYRSKNDVLGKNMSVKNPHFKKRLLQYLYLLDAEISAGKYVSYNV